MMRFSFSLVGLLSCAALAGIYTVPAQAQTAWPGKQPVRIVVPFPPGGGGDTLGRFVARHLSDRLNQSFVIENRTGAGGMIGWHAVQRADPDGYMFLIAGLSLSVTQAISSGQAYDVTKDLSHVALLGGPPTVLIVNADKQINDVPGLIAHTKKTPGGLNWGSSGAGTHSSLIGDLFRRTAKLEMVHIMYRGGGPAVMDVAAGHLPAAFVSLSGTLSQIKAGKVKPLAITSSERLAELPDVPTFKELGYPRLSGAAWFAISGPPGLPRNIAERLNAEVRSIMGTPEAKAELLKQNMETFLWDLPTFNKFAQSEIEFWTPYTKEMLQTPAKK